MTSLWVIIRTEDASDSEYGPEDPTVCGVYTSKEEAVEEILKLYIEDDLVVADHLSEDPVIEIETDQVSEDQVSEDQVSEDQVSDDQVSEDQVSDQVIENVTDQVTDDVTDQITDDATNQFTDQITNDVTEIVTNQITNDVTDQITEIVGELDTETESVTDYSPTVENIQEQRRYLLEEKTHNTYTNLGNTYTLVECVLGAKHEYDDDVLDLYQESVESV